MQHEKAVIGVPMSKPSELAMQDWVDRFEHSIAVWLKEKLTADELRKLANFIQYEILSTANRRVAEAVREEREAIADFICKNWHDKVATAIYDAIRARGAAKETKPCPVCGELNCELRNNLLHKSYG